MSPAEVVRVVLVDAGTGQEFARTELSAGQLPDSFEPATRLDLGGEPWTVVRADPPTATEFLASGSLVLVLRRIEQVDPREIRYSLPTFFDPLPPAEAPTGTGEPFVIHEDDWRQTEMVSRRLAGQVEAELRAIRRIHRQHSRVVGEGASSVHVYDEIHIRRAPTAPLATEVPQRRLFELLPVGGTSYTGVRCRDEQGRVVDSFAVDAGPLTVYGQSQAGRVTVLCLAPSADAPGPSAAAECAAGLARAMREFDLLLVDWCGGLLVDASGVGDFLNPA
ncbi:hypothetical protein ACFYXS_14775 [Streptomyces sp. NPDC002574]|uniref:hypothetical protein n=1 Tax=Streptomyces sp. NPDC002574 TaxID=3364652 RepID=UPI0036AC8176